MGFLNNLGKSAKKAYGKYRADQYEKEVYGSKRKTTLLKQLETGTAKQKKYAFRELQNRKKPLNENFGLGLNLSMGEKKGKKGKPYERLI